MQNEQDKSAADLLKEARLTAIELKKIAGLASDNDELAVGEFSPVRCELKPVRF